MFPHTFWVRVRSATKGKGLFLALNTVVLENLTLNLLSPMVDIFTGGPESSPPPPPPLRGDTCPVTSCVCQCTFHGHEGAQWHKCCACGLSQRANRQTADLKVNSVACFALFTLDMSSSFIRHELLWIIEAEQWDEGKTANAVFEKERNPLMNFKSGGWGDPAWRTVLKLHYFFVLLM